MTYSLSGWSMLVGVLAAAGAFATLFPVAYLILGYSCMGESGCDTLPSDLALAYYSLATPAIAFLGSIISNSRARLGGVILIATGATTFFPLSQTAFSGYDGMIFSIYTLPYLAWVALLFYAGYLSLKEKWAGEKGRRIWDPDLER
jgi:hypothetical protein